MEESQGIKVGRYEAFLERQAQEKMGSDKQMAWRTILLEFSERGRDRSKEFGLLCGM
jgi:hypothetical protein